MVAKFSAEDQIIARSLSRKLQTRQRQVVALRFWYDCSIFEIAGLLGISWDEADRVIKDALVRLKQGCLAHPHFSRTARQPSVA